jgi:anaerobic dimethyl sulfoxide reductase subunit C (anchor subunit)
MLKEWPLVAFTVTAQLAVGVYLLTGSVLFLAGRTSGGLSAHGERLAVPLAVLGLMGVAAFLSLFHLHRPARAWSVLSNVGTSWLSREILSGLTFTVFAALLGYLESLGTGSAGLIKTLYVLGGLAGAVFILTMARLYMLPAVPAWNGPFTPLSFFLTSVVLGATASSLFFSRFATAPPSLYRLMLVTAVTSAGTVLACAVLLTPGHGILEARAAPSLRPPGRTSGSLFAARLAMLLAGLVLLATAAFKAREEIRRPLLLVAAFSLVLAGEIAGRFLFYALAGAINTKQIK